MINIIHVGRQPCTQLWLSTAFLLAVSSCAQTPIEEHAKANEPPAIATATAAPLARQAVTAGPVTLRPDHPQTYTVAPNDSLVEVAARFLNEPWRWPEVWRPAPGIANPERIYPGDVIELYYEHGQPRLRLASTKSIIKLSPQVRSEALTQPIPAIPRSAIEAFLKRSMVLNAQEWEAAPRIIGNVDGRVLLGKGDRIYVRGDLESDQRYYQVFHPGEQYRDPITKQSLGMAGIYVGDAILEQEGDPSTLVLTTTRRDARTDDRLFPARDEPEIYSFLPHAPPLEIEGRVIAVPDNTLRVGQYQSVIVNLGDWDGMKPGHLLKIHSAGRDINESTFGPMVHLPDEKTGTLMLYQIHERVSYGLVMNAERDVRILDRVTNP